MFVASDLLPLLLLLPLLATLLFAFVPFTRGTLPRLAAIFAYVYAASAALASIFVLGAETGFGVSLPAFQIGVQRFEFIPRLFLDGRNAPFILLLGLCPPVVFTFLRNRDDRYGKSHYICAFALIFSLAGVFTSDSLLLFYFFWEAALIAVYFWIGLHGRPGFHAAAVYPVLLRFVLFTLAGSLPMLLSIAAVCAADFRDPGLSGLAQTVAKLSPTWRPWVFGGFLLGFAVKLPLFGFHGWLRDTYNVAPAPCRALLSAAMSKMGAFGLIMVLAPAFGNELHNFGPQLQILAVMGILYGALLALSQQRLLDILTYGSLSHLSILALGVFASAQTGSGATGVSGAVMLALSHALIMVMLFSFDARVLEGGESPDTGLLAGARGAQRKLAAFLLFAAFASASLPGLNNFPGEILVLLTAFRVSPWLSFFAGLGALIGAAALIRAFHALFLGVPPAAGRPVAHHAPDLYKSEVALALIMAVVWLILGLYPMLLLRPVEKALLFLNAPGWSG